MCLVLIIRKILKWSLQLKDHHSPHNLFHLQPFFFFFYFSSVFLPLPPSSVITNSFFSLCNVNRGSDGILVCMVDEDMVKLVCKLFLCHLPAVLLKCSPSRKLEQPPFFLVWYGKSYLYVAKILEIKIPFFVWSKKKRSSFFFCKIIFVPTP